MIMSSTNMFSVSCSSCGRTSFTPNSRQPDRSERVEALLKSNEAPFDAERAALRGVIEDAPHTLYQYDEQIALLRGHLELLVQEREKLQTHVDDAKNLLHPVRTLPDDILLEIFTRCVVLPDDLDAKLGTTPDYSSLNSKNAPWSLSQVSSRWRSLVLASPLLWSTLIFAFPRSMENGHSNVLELAKFSYNLTLFHYRSKTRDLCVSIRCGDNISEIHPMVSIALQVSALRWTCLRFDGVFCLLSVLSTMSFERLEVVVVHRVGGGRLNLLNPFRSAKRLRQVRVLRSVFNCLRFPLDLVSEYEVFAPSISDTLAVHLASMPRLRGLTLRHVSTVTTQSLSLPNLQTLSILSNTPTTQTTCLSELFTVLDSPVLKDLRLYYLVGTQFPDNYRFPLTSTLMSQLSCLVIGFDAPILSNPDVCSSFVDLLRHGVNITKLVLSCGDVISSLLLDSLVVRPGNSVRTVLPRLRVLDLRGTKFERTIDVKKKMYSIIDSRLDNYGMKVAVDGSSQLVTLDALQRLYVQKSMY